MSCALYPGASRLAYFWLQADGIAMWINRWWTSGGATCVYGTDAFGVVVSGDCGCLRPPLSHRERNCDRPPLPCRTLCVRVGDLWDAWSMSSSCLHTTLLFPGCSNFLVQSGAGVEVSKLRHFRCGAVQVRCQNCDAFGAEQSGCAKCQDTVRSGAGA